MKRHLLLSAFLLLASKAQPQISLRMNSKYTLITALACFLFTSLSHAQSPTWDVNGDGTLNMLVIGTSTSIGNDFVEFSPSQITTELQNILLADTSISLHVNVVAEDIYRTKNVSTGLGNQGFLGLDYHCHSLAQYYYWPDGRDVRMDNLTGNNGIDWDYVVIGADPFIVSNIPGYYALGVNKIAAKVVEGGAIPLLLMMWPKDRDETSLNHFEEFTYRTADGAKVQLQTIPAGLAWSALPDTKVDTAMVHPTPNGAYLCAASIYSHISNKSAASSQYIYDDLIADICQSTLMNQAGQVHYAGNRTFISPYKSCEISEENFTYNQNGTSTEGGILDGLQWVFTEGQKTLQFGTDPPIHFNYGRSFAYIIDPLIYDFSFGFPLQDAENAGELSMLYGLDKRENWMNISTDLGLALKMVRDFELPHARNIPLRTLIAQMLEEIPGVEIYSDGWHLSSDVNKAIGTYMYTMLTSDCALAGELAPSDSAEWRTWMAHKIGYETAWHVMHLEGLNPCYSSALSIQANQHVEPNYLVYPNPTNGNFSIDLGDNYHSVTITISDIIGKQILSKTYINTQLLNFTLNKPAGVYTVTIGSDKKISTTRIVKR